MRTVLAKGPLALLFSALLLPHVAAAEPGWSQPQVDLTVTGHAPFADGQFTKAVVGAAYVWTQTEAGPAFSVGRDPQGPTEPAVDGVNAVFFVEEWPGEPEQLALTYTHRRDGEIIEADLAINAAHHRFSPVGELETGSFDLQNLIAHELGHVLGVPHLEDEEASMFDRILPEETKKRDLEPADIEALEALYAHRPLSTGGCAGTGTASGALPFFALTVLLTIRRRARISLPQDPTRRAD